MHYLALVVSEVWLYILKCESLRSVLVQPLFTDEKTQVWVSACSSLWLTLFGHNICAEASSYHPTDPGRRRAWDGEWSPVGRFRVWDVAEADSHTVTTGSGLPPEFLSLPKPRFSLL